MEPTETPRSSKRKAEDETKVIGSKRVKLGLDCVLVRHNPLADCAEVRHTFPVDCAEVRHTSPVDCAEVRHTSPAISVTSEYLEKAISEEKLLELLHYSALGKAPGRVRRPSWCHLRRQRRLTAVCVAVVEHVSQRDFYQHYLSLPNLRTNYTVRLTLSSSSSDLVSDIFSSEVHIVPQCPQKKRDSPHLHPELRTHPVITKYGIKRRGLTAYLLTADDMAKRKYPLIGSPGSEDYVRTDSDPEVTNSSPLFGLDCEMCLTKQGYELTRVSLVDSSGACLLDELVKPHNKILNYLTQFSGVTPEMLEPVQTTLSDVQARLRSLLPRDAVLVGHSLDSDLRALKMMHPHVIDTSLLYSGHCGHRFKLKHLAEVLLQKQIQTEDRCGHDPCEDAVAALELAQHFICSGPLKIVEQHLDLWGLTLKEEPESSPAAAPSSRFADLLQACGRSSAFCGPRTPFDMCLPLSRQQWHSSDREVLLAFRCQPKCAAFTVLQFTSGQTAGAQVEASQKACPPLRDLCVVLAGPLPPQSSEEDVRLLLCFCGPLLSIRLINTAACRVHAEVQFELPESAVIALSSLTRLTLHGRRIQVKRPLSDSTLDVCEAVEALASDPLTRCLLYVACSLPGTAASGTAASGTAASGTAASGTAASGTAASGTAASGTAASGQVNGRRLLTEDSLMDTFSCFGPVLRVVTRGLTHAYIEFVSADSRRDALSSSQDLFELHFLLCPALTPLHLSAPGPAPSTASLMPAPAFTSKAAARRLRKLDRRLGKVFRCLPEGSLSVVVLRGGCDTPGLCFVEVKDTS
ncbi:unnamed protein product [Knipowitschia caucasica]